MLGAIEVEKKIYESKMRLFSWFYNEIDTQSKNIEEMIHDKGKILPINL